MKKIRLMIHCPNPKDSTSFYRGIGPLSHMARMMDNLDLHFTSEYNWATLALGDVLFMQRPYTEQHFRIIELARANRKPVWIDLDDDLFNVPKSNPAYAVYGNDETKKWVARCLSRADHVTVSTEQLKRQIQGQGSPLSGISLNDYVSVVPNALNERILNYYKPPKRERQPLIMWRGSATHDKDLYDFSDELCRIVRDNPKWTFLFQGGLPWWLSENLADNAVIAPALDPVEYFETIHKLKPQAMLVPLSDDVFNRSKSNIAWIEGAFAGAVTVAPNWEEWKNPGCIRYDSPEHLPMIVDGIVKGLVDVDAAANSSWRYVQENLTLEKVNEKRIEVLNSLTA